MSETAQPLSDRVWSIEMHGIDAISEKERHGTPFELFWVWFAADIGLLTVVYGGILSGAGLNFWQSIFVTLAGTMLSFALVGVLSLAGIRGGAPMLTLSRAVFGARGNLGPTLISWFTLVGWETALVVTAAYAMLGLLSLAGLPSNGFWTVVSLLVVVGLVIPFSLLGHATLVWIQRAATWLFGLLTLVVVVLLIRQTDWAQIWTMQPGPWDSGVLATLSIVAAGTGIGWINMGADYTRYLPRRSSSRAVIGWTTLGGALPVCVLILVGFLLTSHLSHLTSAANPIQLIGSALPAWMAIPYLLTAIGGLIAGADLNLYSSGLNLLTLGLKLQRYKTVLIDGLLMVAGAIYVMLIARDFLGSFESFLQLLADGLTAWGAVFLIDMLLRREYDAASLADSSARSRYYYRGGFHPGAIVAWLAGILVGLAFTVSPFFTGPFARGIFATSSLGYLIGFVISGALYAVLLRFSRTNAQPAKATE
ncbi:MAG TPA: cytosine permease [Ktedonobacteraceae bacterium]|jgi:purine-cytosine permease-like protein